MEYYEPIDRLLDWCDAHPGARTQYYQEISGIADQYGAYAHDRDTSVAESVITDGIRELNALRARDHEARLARLKACSSSVLILTAREADTYDYQHADV